MEKIIGTVPGKCRKKREKARLTLNNNPEISWHMKKSRRTYNGVHLNKKSNTQDVVEQSLTKYPDIQILNITMMKELQNKSYEELVQLQQEGKITLVEFVEAQSELTDEWKEWIDTRPISDESARAFLAWHEEYAMNHQEQ